jgi:hypothetical protein
LSLNADGVFSLLLVMSSKLYDVAKIFCNGLLSIDGAG